MSAPNLLRVGTIENVFVEIQDWIKEDDIGVDIIVQNYPSKTTTLYSRSVTLTKTNSFQAFGQIVVMLKYCNSKLFP